MGGKTQSAKADENMDNMQIKINEDADKCCLCIPIDTGVKIIGIFCILNAIRVVQVVLWALSL